MALDGELLFQHYRHRVSWYHAFSRADSNFICLRRGRVSSSRHAALCAQIINRLWCIYGIVFESNCNAGNTVLPSRLLCGASKVSGRYLYTRVIRAKHVCVFFDQNAVVKPGFPKNSWHSFVGSTRGPARRPKRRSSFLRELYAYDPVRTSSRENSTVRAFSFASFPGKVVVVSRVQGNIRLQQRCMN